MEEVRVLIVATDPLARAGLSLLLAGHPECVIVAQIAADEAWPESVEAFQADVVLWDLGWEASEPLPDLSDLPWPVVILLPDESMAGRAWAAGARGLLRRDGPVETMVAAMHAARQELLAVDARLAAALSPAGQSPPEAPLEALTPREAEVLQLLAEGLTNKAIAQRLAISDHTVKYHVNAILSKLGAQSRTEAVVRATRLGLIAL